MREYPIRRTFHIVVRVLQSLDALRTGKAHGAQHGDAFLIRLECCPCTSSSSGRLEKKIVDEVDRLTSQQIAPVTNWILVDQYLIEGRRWAFGTVEGNQHRPCVP